MSLKQKVKRGDWVRATTAEGSIIEAQALHDLSFPGSASLELLLSGTQNNRTILNVNHWDVEVIRRNMIGEE